MSDREKAITHLMIIHTWAEFARKRDLQFFTEKHLEDIAKWTDDALKLLKEQEAQKFLVEENGKITPLPVVFPNCPLKEHDADKPKGHWMPYEPDKRGYTDGFTCSRCERVILSDHYCKMIDFDYCPYCGAYMDNEEGR